MVFSGQASRRSSLLQNRLSPKDKDRNTPCAQQQAAASARFPSLPTMSGIGVRFVSDEVKRDHRDLEELYKRLLQAVDDDGGGGGGGGHDDQGSEGTMTATAALLQSRFSWELARHLVAMQLFVFPGTEQRADEGNGKALRRRGDLAAVSVTFFSLFFFFRFPVSGGVGDGCWEEVPLPISMKGERVILRAY